MKSNNKWIYIIPILLTMLLSRYISAKYGQEANDKFGLVIAGLVILIFTVGIVYLAIKKYYWISIGAIGVFIPIMMCIIGKYKGNESLWNIGGVLTLIVLFALFIISKNVFRNK